jgi:hypothetical protein
MTLALERMISGRQRRAEPVRPYNIACPPVIGTTAPEM